MHRAYPLAEIRTLDTLREEAAALLANPRFSEVLFDYTVKMVTYREQSRDITKLISNEDRYRILNYCYFLWAEKVANGASGALRYGEVFEICQRGEVSPRVLKNWLGMATHAGFLQRSTDPRDRRVILYTPTEDMLTFPLRWLLPAAGALDELRPGAQRVQRLRESRDLLVHFFRSAGREFAHGIQPMTLQPEFMELFGLKDGGDAVGMALLIAEWKGQQPPSRAEMAENFGLTKSQVTQLLATGQTHGLIEIESGLPRSTPALRSGQAQWVAFALAFLGHHIPADER